MKSVEVNITLDPVSDGASIINLNVERKDEGALIIGTNGDRKKASLAETVEILTKIQDISYGDYLGNTPYVVIINAEKILSLDGGAFFIGSALIMKDEGKGKGLELLTGDEFDEAAKVFASRLVTLTANGQDFSAYEIYSGGSI